MKYLIIFSILIAFAKSASLFDKSNELIYGFPENDQSDSSENIVGRITSGHEAEPHSAPFIVSIKSGSTKQHICGGSIITKNTILTAAHCVQPNLYVVAGLHDRSNETDAQTIKVKGYIGHEKYAGGMAPYDIGLLHLESPIEFNENIQPINLPDTSDKPNGEVTLFGWGRVKANSYNLPTLLQTVKTDLLPYQECHNDLPEKHQTKLHETNICSASRNNHISACNADSGGPLVQQLENKEYVQVGVVSWGVLPCGSLHKPSIYTHIGSHLEWIKINTKK